MRCGANVEIEPRARSVISAGVRVPKFPCVKIPESYREKSESEQKDATRTGAIVQLDLAVSDVEEEFQVEVVEGAVLGNNLADLVEVLGAEVSEGFDAVDVLAHELCAPAVGG